MTKRICFALWGIFFTLCAGLGFVPEGLGLWGTVLAAVSFAPPAWLILQARKTGDRDTLALIRNLAAASLGLTLGLLVLSFLLAFRWEALGDLLHILLTILSSPMLCSGHWALSLFLWACLLTGSQTALKKRQ